MLSVKCTQVGDVGVSESRKTFVLVLADRDWRL